MIVINQDIKCDNDQLKALNMKKENILADQYNSIIVWLCINNTYTPHIALSGKQLYH